jgi:hypothetical protein
MKHRTEALTGNEVRPVTTEPRTPAEHYAEAQRLLAAAESSVEVAAEQIQQTAALAAIAHALLAAAPRRARRRQDPPARHGDSPQQRWLYGHLGDDQ